MPEVAKMKPLIFATRSIRAWQRGAKTQTRRLVRPQPNDDLWYLRQQEWDGRWAYWRRLQDGRGIWIADVRQPYALGDLLWIREALVRSTNHEVLYEADKTIPPGWDGVYWDWVRNKLPAMFMPRWACRYYARVLAVRPERLQDISDEDAVAEGVLVEVSHDQDLPRWLYVEWWTALHNKPGTRWQDNPWVWAYGIEEVKEWPKT